MNKTIFKQPPLSDALSVTLPAREDTLLLRACLQPGESGMHACRTWLKAHPEPTRAIKKESIKALLPLLFNALRTHGIAVDNAFLTILRTAAVREEVRTNTYRSICRSVLATLATNQIPTILLRGAALADTVYAAPALRHSHDIDLLSEPRYWDSVVTLLASLGFVLRQQVTSSDCPKVVLEHRTRLPLVLHPNLFEIPFYNPDLSELWSRSQTRVIADVAARVLSPTDALLHLCGHAAYSPSRESFRWITDAWFVIDRHRDMDWKLLLDCAQRHHLTLPLSVALGYLSMDLSAPIPSKFLDSLFSSAAKSTAIGRELALFGARSDPRVGFKSLFRRTKCWRGRAYIIKWMLFPSAAYALWIERVRISWLLPIHYLRRPIRYASRRIRPKFAKFIRGNGRRKNRYTIAP